MWGALNKGAAANLCRQQDQFCSSLKDTDDSERGWGDVAERDDSTKVGWGKASRASSQTPITGWGTNNTKTAIRGWGSSQTPAPPPDLSSELANDTRAMKPEQKSSGNFSPRTNGWGPPAQSSKAPKFQKQVKPSETGDIGQMERLSPAVQQGKSEPKGTYSSLFKTPKQQSQTDTRSECARTEPLTNGCISTSTQQTPRSSPANATRTESTQTKPASTAGTAKPPSTQVPPAANANVSVRPKTNATARTRDLYVPPRAKLAASNGAAAAAVSSTNNTVRTEKATIHKETSITISTRASAATPRKTNSALPPKPSGGTASVSPPAPSGKAEVAPNKGKDMFIIAQSEKERFKELILLLENHPHRRPALLIVDRTRTDPVLLSALLCLAGQHTSPTTIQSAPEPPAIRVICTDELNTSVTPAQLVVSVDMVNAFHELGERMKFLEKNGLMKTVLVPAKDSVRAANLASMFRDCGLPVPLQLECFLPRDDQ